MVESIENIKISHSRGSNLFLGNGFVAQNWWSLRKNDNWKKFSSDHELFENLKKWDKKWDNRVPGLQVIGIPSQKCEKCYKMKAVDRKMVQKVGQTF